MAIPSAQVELEAILLCGQAALEHREGRLQEALGHFEKACDVTSTHIPAWNGRAAILAQIGRMDEAADVLQAGLVATNDDTSIRANLAILQERIGRFQEAIANAEKVLAVDKRHLAARLTLGLSLMRNGQAKTAVPHFQELTSAQSDNADAFLNLGEAYMAVDDYDAALTAYSQAIQRSPALVPAKVGKGQALAMLGQFDAADKILSEVFKGAPQESRACFQRTAANSGQRVPPGWFPRAQEIFLSHHWLLQQKCDWQYRDQYLAQLQCYADQLAEDGSPAYDDSLAFQSMTMPLTGRQRRGLLDAVAAGIVAAGTARARQRLSRPPGPLRLGFMSTGFRDHPSAQLHWRHFSLYDRRHFRIHAYSFIHDASSHLHEKVAKNVDSFCDLSRATPEEACWRIARDGIDILVDLAGYQDNSRPEVLEARPAPLQVSYHGTPLSMGARLVDYRITDRIATPVADEFTEALAYLPLPHSMYNDEEPIAKFTPTRQECGLPANGFVFCAFNSAFKIEPEVFGVWMTLLRELPGSVLWLSDAGKSMRDNLRREAMNRGVVDDRLIFAPRIERAVHLARHACADLFLDTFLCNAHTTATDALWAGLPVLTRIGDTMAGRFAASLVTAAGLPELVVTTCEDYLTLATRLATMPGLLDAMRQRLQGNRGSMPVFATRRRVQHLEAAFETMWKRHCRGEPPATFEVPAS
jgi:protein O-GlcNAc transferase